MGKEKKKRKLEESTEEAEERVLESHDELSYQDKLRFVSVIAKPMASRKLTKKLYKLIKKASKHKTYVRAGLKDVQSRIRKGEKGLVILAGDVTPVDIMCHIPGVCEELNMPYVYTPSKQDIGTAMGVKRASLMVMIREKNDYEELYSECAGLVKNLPLPI